MVNSHYDLSDFFLGKCVSVCVCVCVCVRASECVRVCSVRACGRLRMCLRVRVREPVRGRVRVRVRVCVCVCAYCISGPSAKVFTGHPGEDGDRQP